MFDGRSEAVLPIPNRTSLKFIGAALGVVSAVVLVVLFNSWLKKQGDDEAAVTAAQALRVAEIRIGQAVAALEELSSRGIDSCGPAHLQAMRQAALLTGPVKQIMLIGPDGQPICADTGGAALQPEVLGAAPGTSATIAFDVIRLSGGDDRFLRIRKQVAADKPGLAALVPAGLLMPEASAHGGRLAGAARLAMSDSTLIGASGEAAEPTSRVTRAAQSPQYPLTITVAMPRASVIASADDLRRIGVVITGGVAVAILAFALLFVRRQPVDPAAGMAKAIRDDEFVPYYQPVVDLQSGRLLGAEVLVRWRQPDGSLLEPNAFVLMLESSGLVLDFTRRLMRRVKQELGEAVALRPAMTLAFNVAPRHFDDALILNDVATIFDNSGVRLSQIVLELTERNEVANLTAMRRTIAALQRVGCKVAIDDVGTGHSGLSYILKLGVDIIKIDKIFVEAIGSESHSKAIIETLIDLAKTMRMEIVAEGVETFDQVSYLRERGIGAAQGFVFAPPLPVGTFLQLLEAMDPVTAAAA